jgi:hypothetical protein
MGAFGNSFQLVKESLKVLKKDKELIWFPIISGIVSLFLFLSFILPVFYIFVLKKDQFTMVGYYYLILFAYYFLSYLVVIYFNAGLIACAHMRLNGKDPKFKDGIHAANQHFGKILGWALIAGTVGLILRQISERSNLFGKIVVGILGTAWNLLTFFVIPVMIIENKGVFSSLKESASLFKKTWGENIITQFSIGVFFFVMALLGLVPLIIAIFSGSIIAVIIVGALVILYWLAIAILSSSLSGIFTAALYNYAKTGKVPEAFSPEVIQGAYAAQ